MLQTCHKALAGSGLGRELLHTCPADILALNWLCGKTAAFDLSVTSPLNPSLLSKAGLTAGSAAVAAELRKHSANDAKSSELGWTCMHSPCGGAWGREAVQAFSQVLLHTYTLPQGPPSPSPRWTPTCMAA